jgi:hypothetical protein
VSRIVWKQKAVFSAEEFELEEVPCAVANSADEIVRLARSTSDHGLDSGVERSTARRYDHEHE